MNSGMEKPKKTLEKEYNFEPLSEGDLKKTLLEIEENLGEIYPEEEILYFLNNENIDNNKIILDPDFNKDLVYIKEYLRVGNIKNTIMDLYKHHLISVGIYHLYNEKNIENSLFVEDMLKTLIKKSQEEVLAYLKAWWKKNKPNQDPYFPDPQERQLFEEKKKKKEEERIKKIKDILEDAVKNYFNNLI